MYPASFVLLAHASAEWCQNLFSTILLCCLRNVPQEVFPALPDRKKPGTKRFRALLWNCYTRRKKRSGIFPRAYSRTYFRMNSTVSTYISGLIFFSRALPVMRFSRVQEMTPMAMPSEML